MIILLVDKNLLYTKSVSI